MKLSLILAVAASVIAVADSLPAAAPDDTVEQKVETCRVKDPRADNEWRTGRCRKTKHGLN